MPNKNGTGPRGQGPRATGKGRGRGGKRQGLGGSSDCVCPECGHKESHKRGVPCTQFKCPECGTSMEGQFCR